MIKIIIIRNLKYIIAFIIVLEIIAILLLFEMLSQKKKVSITPLDVKGIQIEKSDLLEWYYTLPANTVVNDNEQWLPNKRRQTITSQGFNERFLYNKQKPENTFRIMTIGDSFTYGLYINTEDNYPESLEDLFDKNCKNMEFEVINAGVPGYDAEYISQTLKKIDPIYNADLIIWLVSETFNKVNEYIIPEANKCRDHNSDKINNIELKDGTVQHLCGENVEASVKLTPKQIREYQKQKADYLFSNLETDWLIILENGSRRSQDVKEYFKEKSETFRNIKLYTTPLTFTPGNEISLPDGHPNEKGHKLLADEVFKYLINTKMISCN